MNFYRISVLKTLEQRSRKKTNSLSERVCAQILLYMELWQNVRTPPFIITFAWNRIPPKRTFWLWAISQPCDPEKCLSKTSLHPFSLGKRVEERPVNASTWRSGLMKTKFKAKLYLFLSLSSPGPRRALHLIHQFVDHFNQVSTSCPSVSMLRGLSGDERFVDFYLWLDSSWVFSIMNKVLLKNE